MRTCRDRPGRSRRTRRRRSSCPCRCSRRRPASPRCRCSATRWASAPCPARPAAASDGPRRVMRYVAQDPAQLGDLGTQRIRGSTAAAATRRRPARAVRGSRAPRRRTRWRPSPRRPRRRPRSSPGSPPHRQARVGRPTRTPRRGGSSRAARQSAACRRVRRPEVGRTGQQVRVRPADQACRCRTPSGAGRRRARTPRLQ